MNTMMIKNMMMMVMSLTFTSNPRCERRSVLWFPRTTSLSPLVIINHHFIMCVAKKAPWYQTNQPDQHLDVKKWIKYFQSNQPRLCSHRYPGAGWACKGFHCFDINMVCELIHNIWQNTWAWHVISAVPPTGAWTSPLGSTPVMWGESGKMRKSQTGKDFNSHSTSSWISLGPETPSLLWAVQV